MESSGFFGGPVVNIDDVEDDSDESPRDQRSSRRNHQSYDSPSVDHRDLSPGTEPGEPTPSPLRAALADFYFAGMASPPSPMSPNFNEDPSQFFASRDEIGTIAEESEHGSSPSSKRSSNQSEQLASHAKQEALATPDHQSNAASHHARIDSFESGVKVPGRGLLDDHRMQEQLESHHPQPTDRLVLPLQSHHASSTPQALLSPPIVTTEAVSSHDTYRTADEDLSPLSRSAEEIARSTDLAQTYHPARDDASLLSPPSPALATTASLSPRMDMTDSTVSSKSSPRRPSSSSLKAVSRRMRTLSRSFSKLSGKSNASSPSASASHNDALSPTKSPLLLSPDKGQRPALNLVWHHPTLNPPLPERQSSLRGKRSSKGSHAPSDQPAERSPETRPFPLPQFQDNGENPTSQHAEALEDSHLSPSAPSSPSTWRKRLSSMASSRASVVASSPTAEREGPSVSASKRRNSLKTKIGDAIASLALPSPASTTHHKAASPRQRRQSSYLRRGIGPHNVSSSSPRQSFYPNGISNRDIWLAEQTVDTNVVSNADALVTDVQQRDQLMQQRWRDAQDIDSPIEPTAMAQGLGQPLPSLLVPDRNRSLRRRPNFSRDHLSISEISTVGRASSAALPPSLSPYSLETMEAAMNVDPGERRPPLGPRKRSQSFNGYDARAVPMVASNSLPAAIRNTATIPDWIASTAHRRPSTQADHDRRSFDAIPSMFRSLDSSPKRWRPMSMFSARKPSSLTPKSAAHESTKARSRPTSVVLGPFALELPEELATPKRPRTSRRFSLPIALDYKAADLRSSTRFARETVIARRSLRRSSRRTYNVNLGVGMSVPLQLSFAAGLAWNSAADDVRRSQARQDDFPTSPGAETDDLACPQWVDSLSGGGDIDDAETVHAATESSHPEGLEAQRAAAWKESMALLEGRPLRPPRNQERTRSNVSAAPASIHPPDSPRSNGSSASVSGNSSIVAIRRRAKGARRSRAESVHYYSTVTANLHSMSQALLAADVPSYISARSANSIISESRPTRIQAQTLSYLNRILDELLLFIVVSARSLATDRIKTDGLLKVLNNNVLAKDAVLEAELELRNYLQGKKAEGGRVPLGLSATSRWDGTEAFPVASAYTALRNRCQYYSTLGDQEDDSVTGDQHIMSAEGRPIATITPGVSIYVTALLEFVGEYILQNVARVIERDNSDEAGLADLKAAIEEDESLITLWRQMVVKQEVEKEMKIVSLGSDRRVTRPWKVPEGSDYDEAATPARFRASMQQRPGTAQGHHPPANWANIDRGSSSVSGHGDYSYSESHSGNSLAGSSSTAQGNYSQTTNTTAATVDSMTGPSSAPPLTRRGSVEKGLSGLFSARRRGSFRNSEDNSGQIKSQLQQGSQVSNANTSQYNRNDSKAGDTSTEPTDDFEALMMSGQTMKVSLTPNRLRTIEVARQEAEAKKARQRPGTLNVSNLRSDVAAEAVAGGRSPAAASPVPSTPSEAARPSSRNSFAPSPSPSVPNRRGMPRVSNPPSSYRGPDPPSMSSNGIGGTSFSSADAASVQEPGNHSSMGRMTPRDKRASWTASKDMMDFLNSSPPSPQMGSQFSGQGLRNSDVGQTSVDSIGKKSGVGGKMRALLGRRSNSGKDSPSPVPAPRVDSRMSSTSSVIGAGGAVERRSSAWSDVHSEARPGTNSSLGHTRNISDNDVVPEDHAIVERTEESEMPSAAGPPVPNKYMPYSDAEAGQELSPAQKAPAMTDEGEGGGGGDDTPALAHTPTMDSVPQSNSAASGGGLGGLSTGAAAGAVAAAAAAAGAGVASLREESRSPSGSRDGSALEDSRPEGPPSRKIPYGRRASRDGGVVAMGRTRSQRSSEGGVPGNASPSVYERANGVSSALGYATAGRSPAINSRSVTANNDGASPPMAGAPSQQSSMSTLRILANLDRQMKLASSVQECRGLVAEALADALRGGVMTPEGADGEIVSSPAQLQPDPAQSVNRPRQAPVLIMSNSYDADADESSPAFKQNGLVAAWLLEGGSGQAVADDDADDAAEVRSITPKSAGISPSNSTGSRLEPTTDSRKVSSDTTVDENAYASADEGDIEDEYESSATEGFSVAQPSLQKSVGVKSGIGMGGGSTHPPSASAAAIRAAKSGLRSAQ